eukprot:COSAG02_NODE_16801_length_1054_cov_1.848168_2_plen_70_part_01
MPTPVYPPFVRKRQPNTKETFNWSRIIYSYLLPGKTPTIQTLGSVSACVCSRRSWLRRRTLVAFCCQCLS